MNIDIFILARSTSNRLPEKHLRKINGKPIIEILVDRMKKSKMVRNVIICTTNLPSDDKLVKILEEKNIKYFRGSDKDILQRLLDAAKYYHTDIIIDVSGDKIYTDVNYVDQVSKILQKEEIDFIRGNNSNLEFDPGDHFVHGIIPGGFKVSALEEICKRKKSNNNEDGYTEFFTSMDFIKKYYIVPNIDFSVTKKIKLDLDYPEDLDLAEKLFDYLGDDFHMDDILKVFSENPDLIKITEPIINEWKINYDKQKNSII
jgi:spore coat polysaccharide biosynthesis protein SpsF (cytidylyltransferase family)